MRWPSLLRRRRRRATAVRAAVPHATDAGSVPEPEVVLVFSDRSEVHLDGSVSCAHAMRAVADSLIVGSGVEAPDGT